MFTASGTQLPHSWEKWYDSFFLLVPVGESHHDVERGQTEVEVEKGIAVSYIVFLIIHGPAYAIFAHHTLSGGPFALLCLHQPVYLSVTGWTDATGGTETVSKSRMWDQIIFQGDLTAAERTWHRGYRRGRWSGQRCPGRPTTAPPLCCCHLLSVCCWRWPPDSAGWGYTFGLATHNIKRSIPLHWNSIIEHTVNLFTWARFALLYDFLTVSYTSECKARAIKNIFLKQGLCKITTMSPLQITTHAKQHHPRYGFIVFMQKSKLDV